MNEMTIPVLMPYQLDPLNGDHFAKQEFLNLRDRFKISTVVELGSCFGSTSLWMAKNFEKVITVEINPEYAAIAKERFERDETTNVHLIIGDTVNVLPEILSNTTEATMVFVDSHWLSHCPMLDELRIIADANIKPVIVIHDFLIPDEPELGYDSYGGQPFNFEWIKPSIEAIYGVDGYDYYYNSAEKSAGAKRGIIYLTPKV